MNVKEQEVTKTQKIYELTEKEFNQMKIDLYNQGKDNVLRYIIFCIQKSRYRLNLWWISHFINELSNFNNGNNYIENSENLTFKEFLDKYGW